MEKIHIFWLEKYNTKIKEIDKNRKTIFEIIKNLYSSLSDGKASHTIINTALLVLKEQSEICFVTEEDYMAKVKFPYLPFHRKVHKSIIAKLDECILSTKEDELDIDKYRNIFDFLNKWVTEHLFEEDVLLKIYIDFVKYYKENNIEISEIIL